AGKAADLPSPLITNLDLTCHRLHYRHPPDRRRRDVLHESRSPRCVRLPVPPSTPTRPLLNGMAGADLTLYSRLRAILRSTTSSPAYPRRPAPPSRFTTCFAPTTSATSGA